MLENYFSAKLLQRIRDALPDVTEESLARNPYILSTIPKVWFSAIDNFSKIKLGKNNPIRITKLAYHVLHVNNDGDVYIPVDRLLYGMQKYDIPDAATIKKILSENTDNAFVFLSFPDLKPIPGVSANSISLIGTLNIFEKEKSISRQLLNNNFQSKDDPEVRKLITSPAILKTLTITPTEEQINSVEDMFHNSITIVTGGPGTGKTSTLKLFHSTARALGYSIAYCAFTGKASRRIEESIGEEGISFTIHRLLGWNGVNFQLGGSLGGYLEYKFIVIDEMSMVDINLFHSLLTALDFNKTKLILTGDADQLQSIGSGKILLDLIDSNKFKLHRYTQPFRQATSSLIIRNAYHILGGKSLEFPVSVDGNWRRPEEGDDFFLVNVEKEEDIPSKITDLVMRGIPEKYGISGFENIQVLSPKYDGECGINNINEKLRKAFFKKEYRSNTYLPGDKLICIQNNYSLGVLNGDMGLINNIEYKRSRDQLHSISAINKFSINLYSGKLVQIEKEEDFEEWALAYCISIHKSQGSEYPVIILPLSKEHLWMMSRQLFYTAITRAKYMVVLVGNGKYINAFINKDKKYSRISGLKQFLESHNDVEKPKLVRL